MASVTGPGCGGRFPLTSILSLKGEEAIRYFRARTGPCCDGPDDACLDPHELVEADGEPFEASDLADGQEHARHVALTVYRIVPQRERLPGPPKVTWC